MSILQPPTDNLYKFMAVGGVVLIVAAILGPPALFQKTGMEYLAQLGGADELKVHEDFTTERLKTLKDRSDSATNEKTKLQERLNQVSSVSNAAEVDKLDGRIKEANREVETIADAAHEARLNLALKRAQIENEETVSINRSRDSRVVMVVGVLAASLGALLSLTGFPLWYFKWQRYQDRAVKKDAEEKLSAPPEAHKKIEQSTPIQPAEVTVKKSAQRAQVNLPQPSK